MYSSCEELESQVHGLRNTLIDLENQLQMLTKRIDNEPANANLKSDRRQLVLDIRITNNELEDTLSKLAECKKATA